MIVSEFVDDVSNFIKSLVKFRANYEGKKLTFGFQHVEYSIHSQVTQTVPKEKESNVENFLGMLEFTCTIPLLVITIYSAEGR